MPRESKRFNRQRSRDGASSGSALLLTTVGVSAVLVFSLTMATMTMARNRARSNDQDMRQAQLMAEAAINDSAASLLVNSSGRIASKDIPARFGNGIFWVDAQDMGDGEYLLRSTALVGSGRKAIEARVARTLRGGANRPFVSLLKSDLKKGYFSDSYDSGLGTYSDQAVNDLGGIAYAGTNGDVWSNGKVKLDKRVTIFGDVYAGPDQEIKNKDKKGESYISGVLANAEEPISLPTIYLPDSVPSAGKVHAHGDGDASTDEIVLESGEHHFHEFKAHKGASVTIIGPATIVIDKKLEIDSQLVIDDSNGPVVFYVGKEVKIKKKAEVEVVSGTPEGLFIVMAQVERYDKKGKLKKKKKHKVKIEADFMGVIYGPETKFELKKETDFYGSVMAAEIKVKKGGRLHYDEALGRLDMPFGGSVRTVTLLSWRTVEVEDTELLTDRRDPRLMMGLRYRDLPDPQQTWEPGEWAPDYYDEFAPWTAEDFQFSAEDDEDEEDEQEDDEEDESDWIDSNS